MFEKARSVTATGEPDGYTPPRTFRGDVFPDGHTRLVVSVPPGELRAVHLALFDMLEGPLGVRYVRLTDRKTGQLPAPEGRVSMGVDKGRARAALTERPALVWGDGRHQLWLRGQLGETVILDELGLLYCSPDDPAFRDVLTSLGIPESDAPMMDKRDYVQVNFSVDADAQEESLWEELKMLKWR